MKNLPIGVSDYKKLIINNYYYVDKTLLIKELLDNPVEVLLIPRPRRFGKTLNLSMLQYFFDCSNSGPQNDHLFYDTKIWSYPEYRVHQGQYPVIYLTLKDTKEDTWPLAYDKIALAIAEEYERHKYLLDDSTLEPYETEKFKRIQSSEGSAVDLSNSIYFLSKLMFKHYGKNVMILLDEYDAPLHGAYTKGYYKDIIGFIRSLLTAAFKDNKYLERGILTGILRTAKEGIFSGLNNLKVYTLTQALFEDKFGFTQSEVEQLLRDMNVTHFIVL
jgi:hypothetical protein